MKQALVRLTNERRECNDINLGDCLRLLRTHRGRTIVSFLLQREGMSKSNGGSLVYT